MRRTRHRQASWSESTTPLLLRPVSVVLVLGALSFLVYLNSLQNAFVFDDVPLIVGYSKIRSIENLPTILGIAGRRSYRPLRTASYAIDYFLFGPNPAGFRAVNIAIHVLNGSLVFFLFRALLLQARPALLAAILFAVHPIQTESVAYIAGRRDLLFTFFYLAGFASYVRYRETDRRRYLVLTAVAYLFGLLSKEMAITLPVLCVCYDVVRSIPAGDRTTPLAPWQAAVEGVRTAVRRNKALYAAGAAGLLVVIWYFAYYKNPSYRTAMYGGGLGPTLLTSARIFVHYIKLLIFPVTLSADYSYNAFPLSRTIADPRVIFAFIILGGVWWGIYRLLPNDRWAAFGGLWFFVTLLPVSQIIPHHELMAEHYLYLPSAGLFLTAGVLLERAFTLERYRASVAAAFALVVVLLSVRTVVRNRDWEDNQTLWTKTVKTAPGSARAHTNVGELALRHRRFSEAYREFQRAIQIQPDDPINRDNIGIILLRYGLFDEAEQQFREALKLKPKFVKPRVNLGLVYLNRRQLDDAEREIRAALTSRRLRRTFRAATQNNLGIVLALKGKNEEAQLAFAEAVRLSPRFADARANLGKLYLEKGQSQEGIAQISEAIRLKASDPRFHFMLGQAYYQQGEKELAALQLAKALSLKTDFPEARALLQKIDQEKTGGRGRNG